MKANVLPTLAGLALATTMWGCEINIENPGVNADGGTSATNNGTATNNGNPNNGTPDAGNNGNPNNGTPDLGRDDAGQLIANDQYPCKDDGIDPELCQGSAEWDRYEDQALIDRGEYLVLHVAVCGDCHTPLANDFMPVESCDGWWAIRDCERNLSGFNFPFYDVDYAVEGLGGIGIPNLTPHPDGLGEWSPEELRTAFTRGVRPERITDKPRIMMPFMPYYQFFHFTEEDQDSIIAYLHSLKPVPSGEPPAGPYDREPMPEGSSWARLDTLTPADVDGDGTVDGLGPAPDDFMPAVDLAESDPNYDRAVNGRYLARIACATCHTPGFELDTAMTDEQILQNWYFADPDLAMAGSVDGAVMLSSWWPGPVFGPTFPAEIRSQNITGDPTYGVGSWTVDELVRSVNGTDKDGEPMCPPMYVDTWFANMTQSDKEDIAIYLQNSVGNTNDTGGMFYDCKLSAQ